MTVPATPQQPAPGAAPPSSVAEQAASQVRAVAAEFASKHTHLADSDLSRDRCIEAAEAFVAACQSAGVTAQVVTGARFGETPHFPGVRLLLNAHSAALICDTDVVYDWTARQFDPAADWPLVQPLRCWREQWSHPDQW